MYGSGHGDLEVRYLVKKKEGAELLVMLLFKLQLLRHPKKGILVCSRYGEVKRVRRQELRVLE